VNLKFAHEKCARACRLLDDLFLFATSLSFVMPGLDPGIHDEMQHAIALQESPPLTHRVMDCRVKPGNDEREAENVFA
jgi:hypothetical protein